MSREPGFTMSAENRAKISAGVRAAIADGRGHRPGTGWRPPSDFREMYFDLRAKLGPTEARRLVEDHADVVRRREAARDGARAQVKAQVSA